MPSCAIVTCRARSEVSTLAKGGITFHRFPKEPDIKEKWIDVTGREDWFPSKSSTICSKHFKDNDFSIKKSGNRYLRAGAIPSENVVRIVKSTSNQKTPSLENSRATTPTKRKSNVTPDNSNSKRMKVQTNEAGLPLPGLSAGVSSTRSRSEQDSEDSNLSTEEVPPAQDPLKKGTLEQCRFCGEFSKDCFNLDADSKPYLETNKTSLTINGLSIELDFNDDTLPKTVCSNCDDKLQVMTDFIKKVIAAQNSLINVADDMGREKADVDTSLVKVEDPEITNTETTAEGKENEGNEDTLELEITKTETTTEDKENEGNEDALELSEVFTHKRTSNNPENKSKPNAKQQSANEQGSSVSNKATESTVLVHKRKSVVSENTVVTPKRKIFKVDIPLQRKRNVRQHRSGNSKVIDNDKEIEINTHTQGRHDVSNVTEDTGLMTDIKEEDIDIEEHEEGSLQHDTAIVYKPDETELASNALIYEMSKS